VRAAIAVALVLALLVVGKIPLAYNLRNLAVRWRITLLTALAFTLVVALLTLMMAFVNGMNRLTEGSGQPGNVIVMSDGATDELFSNLSFDDSSDIAREPGVARDDRGRPLCSRELYVVVSQTIPKEEGEEKERQRFVQVRGIEDAEIASRVHGLELFPGGTWFSQAGVQDLPAPDGAKGGAPAIQCVIGEGVARAHGQKKMPGGGWLTRLVLGTAQFLGLYDGTVPLKVGDVFELGPRKWVVVGILNAAGSTFNSEVWAKGQKVGDEFGKANLFTSMVLRTADAQSAQILSSQLKKYKKAALQAQPETEYYAKLSETNKQFQYAINFIAVVMAIGGVFGVMNTMFAAISQRIKDIGVLRIVGFARWQILVSFLLETLAIALLGGVVGCALGYLADGLTATSIVSSGQGAAGKSVVLRLIVDGDTIAIGLLFALVMGLLGGLLPALSAMRLKPLESLR
jgi:ABC-type lipoprotein release transport system permease subunit